MNEPIRGSSAESGYRDLLNAVHRLDLYSRRSADRRLIASIGVGRAMFLVLDSIADDAGTQPSQQALADRVGLTRAAVSRHVIEAERQGFITVVPSSRSLRENSLALTSSGNAIVMTGRRLRRAAARRCLATVSPQALATTLNVLAHLETVLQADD